MDKLTQVFRNETDQPLFIVLEIATPRYKLAPGEELLLRYEPKQDAPVVIEFENYKGGVGLTIWTREDEILHPDGTPARMTRE